MGMGHKRKAGDCLSPFPFTSPPFPVPAPVQPYSSSNYTPPPEWNTPNPHSDSDSTSALNPAPSSPTPDTSPPDLNTRTRKRFRDNRPDETTIHHNTLEKLYSAQRPPHHPAPHNPTHPLDHTSPISSRDTHLSPSPSTTHHPKQKSQASLHAFFHGSSNSSGNTSSQAQPPRTIQDPQFNTHTLTPTTIPQCEDCAAPLLPHPSPDTEMMDLDADLVVMPSFSAAAADGDADAYACAHCRNRVCDTCAVRGDRRVCLECANPGSGYHIAAAGRAGMGVGVGMGMGMGGVVGGMEASGAGEKRWVGGIGWL